jgi:hypothetical protein
MTVRFYVMPLTVTASGSRGPKYLKWGVGILAGDGTGLDVPWQLIDFGFEPTCLVCADVDAAQHTSLNANADVTAAPANIDDTIANATQRDTVRSKLEALNIPAGWVEIGMTFREVLRPCAHLFQFAQRYHAISGRKIIEPGYTLDTIISDIPVEVRQGLKAAADSLGYDFSGISLSWPYRRGLKFLGDQWGDEPVSFGSLATL